MNNANHSASSGSKAHSKLARTIAAAATVLLKNEDALLPIDVTKVKKIAIIGANGGSGVTVHGGGSGAVTPEYVVTPQQGITARYVNGPPSPGPGPAPAPSNCTVLDNDTCVRASFLSPSPLASRSPPFPHSSSHAPSFPFSETGRP